MLNFPLFQKLDVDRYGMFPGSPSVPGLHVEFQSGLTVVLGVNGLGKTTLVTLLFRMCTGPFEIPGLPESNILGTRSLQAAKLQRWDQRIFATRVSDEAGEASATLTFTLGQVSIEVTRALSNLAITRLVVDGVPEQATEDKFQDVVTRQSALPSFGEWILVLRYLTFYFEDRRALVWDPTAQRQMLRLLLLPMSVSSEWAQRERQVLELDSRVRNLQSALNREEGAERRARVKVKEGKSVADNIAALEEELATGLARLTEATDALPAADEARQKARLRALTFEQEYDAARRDLEQLQLRYIAAAFPSGDETGRYLIARLISTETCQTCGTDVPAYAEQLVAAVEASRCVICGSDVSSRPGRNRSRELATRTADVERLEAARDASAIARAEAEGTFDALVRDIAELDENVSRLRSRVATLVRQLPPDERTLREQSAEVSSLRGRLERLKLQLDGLRAGFEDHIRKDMRTIAAHRDAIVTTFRAFAEGFLFESSDLRWAPHKSRVGQTGPQVDFPAFEFEMSGSDFPTPVRRTGPDQVSESQREFVDLAFRMTLMTVASADSAGSLVIDAPEASLDAVFSERAAAVLVRFAEPERDNRVIVTSNLVDGQLIPRLLKEADISSDSDPRVVDLLNIATPTRAVTELRSEYEAVKERLFSDGDH